MMERLLSPAISPSYAAWEFFVRATEYLLASCPFQEDILCRVTWIDFKNRLKQNFSSVEYFVHNYPIFFQGIDMDHLNKQFLNCHLLIDEDIPVTLQSTASDADEVYYHIDRVWGYLRNVQKPGGISFEYERSFVQGS